MSCVGSGGGISDGTADDRRLGRTYRGPAPPKHQGGERHQDQEQQEPDSEAERCIGKRLGLGDRVGGRAVWRPVRRAARRSGGESRSTHQGRGRIGRPSCQCSRPLRGHGTPCSRDGRRCRPRARPARRRSCQAGSPKHRPPRGAAGRGRTKCMCRPAGRRGARRDRWRTGRPGSRPHSARTRPGRRGTPGPGARGWWRATRPRRPAPRGRHPRRPRCRAPATGPGPGRMCNGPPSRSTPGRARHRWRTPGPGCHTRRAGMPPHSARSWASGPGHAGMRGRGRRSGRRRW